MRGSIKGKMVNKYLIGILTLVVLVASVYILIPNNVRIDVGNTYSTFKVWENDSWVLAGQEYSLMFDGTTKMRASSRTVESFVEGEIVKIIRTANFKNNVTVIDTYTFDGNEKDIELFPISHNINVLNGEGYILVYEITKLEYFGETINYILSPQEFGHNMRIEWEEGNYYSRIWGYADRDEGKLTIKYRPDSSDFTKQVRLFDPPEEHTVDNNAYYIGSSMDALRGPYYYNSTNGIVFFFDSDQDMGFRRTTDGGATWGSRIDIEAGSAMVFDTWLDRETPGDSGTNINLAWMDIVLEEVRFVTIDTSYGSVGTIRTVASHTPASNTGINRIAITKTVSGNIVVAWQSSTLHNTSKSSDLFATAGTNIDPFFEGQTNDFARLYPAMTADGNDVAGIYYDDRFSKAWKHC